MFQEKYTVERVMNLGQGRRFKKEEMDDERDMEVMREYENWLGYVLNVGDCKINSRFHKKNNPNSSENSKTVSTAGSSIKDSDLDDGSVVKRVNVISINKSIVMKNDRMQTVKINGLKNNGNGNCNKRNANRGRGNFVSNN